MPTYEYECKKCGYRFEKFQRMSEEPVKKCHKCGGEARRLISGGMGIIFKGSATDPGKSVNSDGTCCGRAEPCDTPPCSDDGVCKR